MTQFSPLDPDSLHLQLHLWAKMERQHLKVALGLPRENKSINVEPFINFLTGNFTSLELRDLKYIRGIAKKLDPTSNDLNLKELVEKIERAVSGETKSVVTVPALSQQGSGSALTIRTFASFLSDDWIRGIQVLEGGTLVDSGSWVFRFINSMPPDSISEMARTKLEKLGNELLGMCSYGHRIREISGLSLEKIEEELKSLGAEIRDRIKYLQPGEAVLLPWGYHGTGLGHGMLLRIQADAQDSFQIEVYNTGEGLEYHHSLKTQQITYFDPVLRFEKIPASVLFSSELLGFFEMIFEPMVLPHAQELQPFPVEYKAEMLYAWILLSLRTYLSLPSSSEGSYIQAQRAGTCSARSVLAYLRTQLQEDYREFKLQMNIALIREGLETFESELRKPKNDDMRKIFRHAIRNSARLLEKEMVHRIALTAAIRSGQELKVLEERREALETELQEAMTTELRNPGFRDDRERIQDYMQKLFGAKNRESSTSTSLTPMETTTWTGPLSFEECTSITEFQQLLEYWIEWSPPEIDTINRGTLIPIHLLLSLPVPSKEAPWHRYQWNKDECIMTVRLIERLVNKLRNLYIFRSGSISSETVVAFHLATAVAFDLISYVKPEFANYSINIDYVRRAETLLWFNPILDTELDMKWLALKEYFETGPRPSLFQFLNREEVGLSAIDPFIKHQMSECISELKRQKKYEGARSEYRVACRKYSISLSFKDWLELVLQCDEVPSEYEITKEITQVFFTEYKMLRNCAQIAMDEVYHYYFISPLDSRVVPPLQERYTSIVLRLLKNSDQSWMEVKKLRIANGFIDYRSCRYNGKMSAGWKKLFPYIPSGKLDELDWCGLRAEANVDHSYYGNRQEGDPYIPVENGTLLTRKVPQPLRYLYPTLFSPEAKKVRISSVTELIERYPDHLNTQETQAVLIMALFTSDTLNEACRDSPVTVQALLATLEKACFDLAQKKEKEDAVHMLLMIQIGIIDRLYFGDDKRKRQELERILQFVSLRKFENPELKREQHQLQLWCLKRLLYVSREEHYLKEFFRHFLHLVNDRAGTRQILVLLELDSGILSPFHLGLLRNFLPDHLNEVLADFSISLSGKWEGDIPYYRNGEYTFDVLAGKLFHGKRPVVLAGGRSREFPPTDFPDFFTRERNFHSIEGSVYDVISFRCGDGKYYFKRSSDSSILFHELEDKTRAYYLKKEEGPLRNLLDLLSERGRLAIWKVKENQEIFLSPVEDPRRVIWKIFKDGTIIHWPDNTRWVWTLPGSEFTDSLGCIAPLETIIVITEPGKITRLVYTDLEDKEGRSPEFYKEPHRNEIVWRQDPKYHIAPLQRERLHLSRILVLEDDEGHADKGLVPVRSYSYRTHSRLPSRYGYIEVRINKRGEPAATSVEGWLILAYMHLNSGDYVRAITALKKGEKISESYTDEELRILGWILISNELKTDDDVNAHAVRLFAAFLADKNKNLHPVGDSTLDAIGLNSPFNSPVYWNSFWFGQGTFNDMSVKKYVTDNMNRILQGERDLLQELSLFERWIEVEDAVEWLHSRNVDINPNWLMKKKAQVRKEVVPAQIPVNKSEYRQESVTDAEESVLSLMTMELEKSDIPDSHDDLQLLTTYTSSSDPDERKKILALEQKYRLPARLRYLTGERRKPRFHTCLPYGMDDSMFIELWQKVAQGGEKEREEVRRILAHLLFTTEKYSVKEGLLILALTADKKRKHFFSIDTWNVMQSKITDRCATGKFDREFWEEIYHDEFSEFYNFSKLIKPFFPSPPPKIIPSSSQWPHDLVSDYFPFPKARMRIDTSLMERAGAASWAGFFFEPVRSPRPSVLEEMSALLPKEERAPFHEEIVQGAMRNAARAAFRLTGDAQKLSRRLEEELYRESRDLKAKKSEMLLLANKKPGTEEMRLRAELRLLGEEERKLAIPDCIALFIHGNERIYAQRTYLDSREIERLHNLVAEYLVLRAEHQKKWRAERLLLQARGTEDESEREQLLGQVGCELMHRREKVEDSGIFAAVLAFEVRANVSAKPELVGDLIRLQSREGGRQNDIVIQRIMAAGKTFFLATVNCLLNADGFHLSIFVPPPSLLETSLEDAASRSEKFFGQETFTFRFLRQEEYFTPEYLTHLYRALTGAIRRRAVVILSPDTFLALENRFIEGWERLTQSTFRPSSRAEASFSDRDEAGSSSPTSASASDSFERFIEERVGASTYEQKQYTDLRESVEMLGKIVKLFREKAKLTCDEADTIFDPLKELNFPVGAPSKLDPFECRLLQDIMLAALSDEDIGPILRENRQTLLQSSFDPIRLQKGMERIVRRIFDDSFWKKILCLKEMDAAEDKIALLKQWNTEGQGKHFKAAGLIVLLKQEIREWFIDTFDKAACVDYGLAFSEGTRSVAEGSPEVAIPYIANNTPSFGSEFADPYRTILYTYHSYLIQGLPEEKINDFAEFLLRKLAGDEALKKAFTEDIGIDFSEFHPTDSRDIAMLQGVLCGAKGVALQLLFDYVREHILSKVRLFREQISGNPQNFGSMGCLVQTFSGTMNEYIFSPRCGKVQRDVGANGQTIDLLLRPERCSPDVLVLSEGKEAEEKADEVVRGGGLDSHAMVDLGAYFQGVSNASVARAILIVLERRSGNRIRGILFFDDRTNVLCCLKSGQEAPIFIRSTNIKMIAEATGLSPEELYTYYDQRHHTGTDIVQCRNAHAVVTVGPDTTTDRLLQAVMRMRYLADTQRVLLAVSRSLAELDRFVPKEALTPSGVMLLTQQNQIRKRAADALASSFQKMNDVLRRLAIDMLLRSNTGDVDAYDRLRGILVRDVTNRLFEQYVEEASLIPLESALWELQRKLVQTGRKAGLSTAILEEELSQIIKDTLCIPGIPAEIPTHAEDNKAAEVKNVHVREMETKEEVRMQVVEETESMSFSGAIAAPFRPWPVHDVEKALLDVSRIRPVFESIGDEEIRKIFSPQLLMTDNFACTVNSIPFRQVDLTSSVHKIPHFMLLMQKEEGVTAILLSLLDASYFTNMFLEGEMQGRIWLVTCDLKLCQAGQVPWSEEIAEDDQVRELALAALILSGRSSLFTKDDWAPYFEEWKRRNGALAVDRAIELFHIPTPASIN